MRERGSLGSYVGYVAAGGVGGTFVGASTGLYAGTEGAVAGAIIGFLAGCFAGVGVASTKLWRDAMTRDFDRRIFHPPREGDTRRDSTRADVTSDRRPPP